MNCPPDCPHTCHDGRVCEACARESGRACVHGAVGLLFFLHPNSHGEHASLEWCPGCGAYRLLPRDSDATPGPWRTPPRASES